MRNVTTFLDRLLHVNEDVLGIVLANVANEPCAQTDDGSDCGQCVECYARRLHRQLWPTRLLPGDSARRRVGELLTGQEDD